MAPVDLSVIMVTHGGRELALTTLRSARVALGSATAEWIVVDNASGDGTPDAIESLFPDVLVIRARNAGFAAGNNIGIARSSGRYVLLLNPDVEILEGTFGELVDAMDHRPGTGLASVVQQGADGRLQPSIRRFPTPGRDLGEALFAARWPVMKGREELDVQPDHYRAERSVDWLVGAFLIARAEAVSEVGEMDERFFLYSEEIDWAFRMHEAGRDVRHLPVMTILHHGGGRSRGDLIGQLTYSRRLFAAKHYGWVKAAAIRAALALGHVLRLMVVAPAALRRPALRARLRGERDGLGVALGIHGPPLSADPDHGDRPAAPHRAAATG